MCIRDSLNTREGLITASVWSDQRPEPSVSLALNASEIHEDINITLALGHNQLHMNLNDQRKATAQLSTMLPITSNSDLKMILGNHISGNRPFDGKIKALSLQ